jgi:hypothetical protein
MKTFKTTIETFLSEAMTQKEMYYILGGGGEDPIDLMIPPKGYN